MNKWAWMGIGAAVGIAGTVIYVQRAKIQAAIDHRKELGAAGTIFDGVSSTWAGLKDIFG